MKIWVNGDLIFSPGVLFLSLALIMLKANCCCYVLSGEVDVIVVLEVKVEGFGRSKYIHT